MSNKNFKNAKIIKNIKKYKNTKKTQSGGGSSDYVQLFHAWGADPAELSRYTKHYIDQAPMFNPLQANAMIPTGTTGIIPTGTYYQDMAPLRLENSLGPPTAQTAGGGEQVFYTTKKGKPISNPWIAHVYRFADSHNITYTQALKDPHIRVGYVKRTSNKSKKIKN